MDEGSVVEKKEESMQTYNFQEMVNSEGSVTLSGLPPLTEVAIVVILPQVSDWRKRMQQLMDDVQQQQHPFATMTREEILQKLRQTREEVAEELYGD